MGANPRLLFGGVLRMKILRAILASWFYTAAEFIGMTGDFIEGDGDE